jgi:hypothetical protein
MNGVTLVNIHAAEDTQSSNIREAGRPRRQDETRTRGEDDWTEERCFSRQPSMLICRLSPRVLISGDSNNDKVALKIARRVVLSPKHISWRCHSPFPLIQLRCLLSPGKKKQMIPGRYALMHKRDFNESVDGGSRVVLGQYCQSLPYPANYR